MPHFHQLHILLHNGFISIFVRILVSLFCVYSNLFERSWSMFLNLLILCWSNFFIAFFIFRLFLCEMCSHWKWIQEDNNRTLMSGDWGCNKTSQKNKKLFQITTFILILAIDLLIQKKSKETFTHVHILKSAQLCISWT